MQLGGYRGVAHVVASQHQLNQTLTLSTVTWAKLNLSLLVWDIF